MPEPRPLSLSFALPEGATGLSRAPRAAPRPRPSGPDDPSVPRLTVALTFDHDATSAAVERGDGPFRRSLGEYGVRVGVPRVLDLLARHDIKSTFFIPGHTAATFPDSVAAIAAGGHELACHGWAHEDVTRLGVDEERALLQRSREAIGSAWGRPPMGFRAPYWSLSERTLGLVEEAGFAYDSSLAWDDFRLAHVRHGDVNAVERSVLGEPGRLLEVPISHVLGDWAPFEPEPGQGAARAVRRRGDVARRASLRARPCAGRSDHVHAPPGGDRPGLADRDARAADRDRPGASGRHLRPPRRRGRALDHHARGVTAARRRRRAAQGRAGGARWRRHSSSSGEAATAAPA